MQESGGGASHPALAQLLGDRLLQLVLQPLDDLTA